jgi:histidinol dehydrogenase
VIERAARNIEGFARAVAKSAKPVRLAKGGVRTGLDWRPVGRAGCYVPAGRHPLPSTALMTALAARAAGVPEIVIACPRPVPEIVFAGTLVGVERFFRIGGAQAVAAMALGTESVPRADVIAGPGNAYVAEAKRQLQGEAGFDLIAGPSEVAVVADASARPDWVALDLLAQAEHDPDARAWLLTDSLALARDAAAEVGRLAESLDLPPFVRGAVAGAPPESGEGRDSKGGKGKGGSPARRDARNPKLETRNPELFPSIAILALGSLAECAEASNLFAPEHLALHLRDLEAWKPRFRHYGAMFLGGESSVAFGDYMAGPNHTLPTGRCARFQGGLTPYAFLRPQAWTRMGKGAKRFAADTGAFADLEGLVAHAAAARARE